MGELRPATQLRMQDLIFGSEALVAEQQLFINVPGD